MTLRSREDLPDRGDRLAARDRQVGISTEGMVAEYDQHISVQAGASPSSALLADIAVTLRLTSGQTSMSVAVGDEDDDPGELTLTSNWVAIWLRSPDDCRVLLLDTRRAARKGAGPVPLSFPVPPRPGRPIRPRGPCPSPGGPGRGLAQPDRSTRQRDLDLCHIRHTLEPDGAQRTSLSCGFMER
jgi:hypothetical protein